jgi:hypothetical protein
MMPRLRYRFAGTFVREDGTKMYRWERHLHDGIRVDQITCPADWFWGKR